ncbi:hypothetical protein HG1285_09576 [Hydrogenivirga sp. 128-5-R1-1]|nr:hypothetical protein HG1285_09576 [Hydrogenivirga sp. 128-5-R1-1]
METLIMVLTIIGLSILAVGGLVLAFLSMKDYLEERKH